MALENSPRPEIVKNSKPSGRFLDQGKEVSDNTVLPDKSVQSPGLNTIKGNFDSSGLAGRR